MLRSPYGPNRSKQSGNNPAGSPAMHSDHHSPQGRGGHFTSTIPAALPLTEDGIDQLSEKVRYDDLAEALGNHTAAVALLGQYEAMISKAKQAVADGNYGGVEIPLIRIGFRDYANAVVVSLPLLRSMDIRMPSSGMSQPMLHEWNDIAVELLPSIIAYNPVCGLMGVIVPLPKECIS